MVLQQFALRSRQFLTASQLFHNISKFNNTATNKFFSVTVCRTTDRRYTDKHEWVQINGKIGTIGISHYAQEALGDVVYAQLPDVGMELEQKDECGALESVKAASELYSPVSGVVTEKNLAVEETPSLINSSCYEKGWLFKVELTNEAEVSQLMDDKKYEEYLKSDDLH